MSNKRSLWCCSIALLWTAGIVGCGGEGRIGISGSVSYSDGTPIESGSIVLDPTDTTHAPRVAGVISNGEFSIKRSDGPTIGTYIVRIYGENSMQSLDDPIQFAERGEQMIRVNPVSREFNEESQLKIEVSKSSSEFQFQVVRTGTDS